jgi:hypothetical protein
MMSIPWLPPYLGTWQDLINSLLNDPFLGSRRGHGFPYGVAATDLIDDRWPPPLRKTEPNPSPWSPAVSLLMSAISMKEVAFKLPEGELRNDIGKRADHAISVFIDDYCGTPPRRIPWPWPGPPPWVYSIVSELAMAANSFQEGSLRNEVLAVAGQITQKAFGSAGAGKVHQE